MKMPVAQKIAVSFETGPVSVAKFCITLKTITNARTGPMIGPHVAGSLWERLAGFGVGLFRSSAVT
jgi:hypothetical protein